MSQSRSQKSAMKKPEKAKGGPPKQIRTKNPPGGPKTPGAKKNKKY